MRIEKIFPHKIHPEYMFIGTVWAQDHPIAAAGISSLDSLNLSKKRKANVSLHEHVKRTCMEDLSDSEYSKYGLYVQLV